MRESVPLWKRVEETMASRRPAARIRGKMPFHNGREIRNLLPLW